MVVFVDGSSTGQLGGALLVVVILGQLNVGHGWFLARHLGFFEDMLLSSRTKRKFATLSHRRSPWILAWDLPLYI